MNSSTLFSVEGKTALVTGGTRGIGLMVAEGLVAAGVTTYVTGRDGELCNETADRLSNTGSARCIGFSADLGTEGGVMALAEAIASRERQLDILVNNAGVHRLTSLGEARFEDFAAVMNPNVAGLFVLTQELLPLLRASATKEDPARIVMMGSSIVVDVPAWDSYAYGASKAAVHYLSRKLAAELASEFITVNCVAPGGFPSRMMDPYVTETSTLEDFAAQQPLGRLGVPADVVGVVLMLCSAAGAYLTGNVISNDGGTTVR
jgi:NAD(P)-dependent dehydrogenase (short-subunit alcohol dehydrogenase family)